MCRRVCALAEREKQLDHQTTRSRKSRPCRDDTFKQKEAKLAKFKQNGMEPDFAAFCRTLPGSLRRRNRDATRRHVTMSSICAEIAGIRRRQISSVAGCALFIRR